MIDTKSLIDLGESAGHPAELTEAANEIDRLREVLMQAVDLSRKMRDTTLDPVQPSYEERLFRLLDQESRRRARGR